MCLAPQQPSKCKRNSSFFLLFLQPRERGRMRFHKLQNVNIALDFLKIRGVSVSLSNSKPTSQYIAVFVRGRQVCMTGVCAGHHIFAIDCFMTQSCLRSVASFDVTTTYLQCTRMSQLESFAWILVGSDRECMFVCFR